jgi:soluble lytic murein transglycosylase-like protein
VRRQIAIAAAVTTALVSAGPAAATSGSVAALQVALRAHGLYAGPVDGISGPLTRTGLVALQRSNGIAADGRLDLRTRRALGALGAPLFGRRELGLGAFGWDVSELEFRLRRFGLPASAVDGRFTAATRAALRRFQSVAGLPADGIAGPMTFRALGRPAAAHTALQRHIVRAGEGFYAIAALYHVDPAALARVNGLELSSVLLPGQHLRLPAGAKAVRAAPAGSRAARPATTKAVHVVRSGEGFFSIAAQWSVSPWELARVNGLELSSVLLPGQRLRLPAGARAAAGQAPASRDTVRAALDHWSSAYGVDPKLVRALAWMESGFQPEVVSNVGALGVMQLLPETWDWVDALLVGRVTPRTYEGNVQAGVRYLRWQLDQFGGDVKLALAGYYQGARAVREIGLYDDTKQYVSIILKLYGSV